MSEKRLRKMMQRKLPLAHIQSHEDKYSSGIPDVSIGLELKQVKANGWIELKETHLPRDLDKPLKIDNLEPQQVQWLKRRGRTGGRCFLFLRATNDYFLIHWTQLDRIGKWSWRTFSQQAFGHWSGKVDWDEFQLIVHSDLGGPTRLPRVRSVRIPRSR